MESLTVCDNQQPKTIYSAESEMLTDDELILQFDNVMDNAPNVTHAIEIEFITPTNVKVEGK